MLFRSICFICGKRYAVTAIGKGSISLAHTGRISFMVAASGNPPIPSNRLPNFNSVIAPPYAATAFTTVLVILMAVWAAYTLLMMLVLVLVSNPNCPAIRGTSVLDNMSPKPNNGWSLNTISPAVKIVDCKNAVIQMPMTCLHHWINPSMYPLGTENI